MTLCILERGIYLKNNDRVLKLLQDISEWKEECQICFDELEQAKSNQLKKLISHSMRAYFLDFHILCEDFISVNLKDLKKFKIDISAVEGMEIIRECNRVSNDFLVFYVGSRRLRNRLAHRYKLPKDEELLANIKENYELIEELEIVMKNMFEQD